MGLGRGRYFAGGGLIPTHPPARLRHQLRVYLRLSTSTSTSLSPWMAAKGRQEPVSSRPAPAQAGGAARRKRMERRKSCQEKRPAQKRVPELPGRGSGTHQTPTTSTLLAATGLDNPTAATQLLGAGSVPPRTPFQPERGSHGGTQGTYRAPAACVAGEPRGARCPRSRRRAWSRPGRTSPPWHAPG